MINQLFGPQQSEDGVTLRLWAPAAKSVDAFVDGTRETMAQRGGGWFTADVQHAAPGSHYRFRIDDEVDVPDPASAKARWHPGTLVAEIPNRPPGAHVESCRVQSFQGRIHRRNSF